MSANQHNIAAFADRMVTLADGYKADVAGVIEEAKKADLDTGGLKRLASWKRRDRTVRDDAEALDHQYRFLAGEVPDAAELPAGGELATAARLYREGMTVTQVQAEMGVSRGKAHKLKTQAAAFSGVHVHVQMNAGDHRAMEAADLGEWTPPAPDMGIPTSVWHLITAPVLEALAAEEAVRVAAAAERARKAAEREAEREKNRRIDADPLDFPAHLKAKREQVPA